MTSTASSTPAGSIGSPYQMVARLLEGAINRLNAAQAELAGGERGHDERGHDERGRSRSAGSQPGTLTSAVSIIVVLRDSLDLEQGGALASNLLELYTYMLRRLDRAWVAGDTTALAEVSGLLATILEGWDAIAPELGEGSHGR